MQQLAMTDIELYNDQAPGSQNKPRETYLAKDYQECNVHEGTHSENVHIHDKKNILDLS